MYNKNTRLCTGRANKMIFQKWARTHDGAKDNSTTKKKRCRAVEKQIKKTMLCFAVCAICLIFAQDRQHQANGGGIKIQRKHTVGTYSCICPLVMC